MPRRTPRTITDPDELMAELDRISERGYAIDDGEQELGVRCVAVPVIGSPAFAALSVSGPSGRMTPETIAEVVPLMRAAAERFALLT